MKYKYLTAVLAFLLIVVSSCYGQMKDQKKTGPPSKNPLLCDPQEGVCETPDSTTSSSIKAVKATATKVQITYFTDPICSSCWGIEPQLRKLKLEYGAAFEIDYRMGGLLPSWDIYDSGGISKPADVAHHWDEVSTHYEMPIDGAVWLEDPLPSSYPPSIAFKAAQIQDKQKALQFLRRIREMVFLEKKNICKWEHLNVAANETGLDTTQFKTDFEGNARDLFNTDLELARSMGVHGFPTMFFSDGQSSQLLVYGFRPYAQYENAILALYPEAHKSKIETDFQSLFAYYPTLTTKEYSTLSNTSVQEAEKILRHQFTQQNLDKVLIENGVLWKRKNGDQ